MHGSIGDVAPMNIRRETNYLHDVVQYPKIQSSSPFLSLGMLSAVLQFWANFSIMFL